jgi:hypothetical protein
MSESSPSTPKPLLFDRYRIIEEMGTGRLVTVYHAKDERLQRDVLLHVLRKDLVGQENLRQRFVTEINASAQRSHPALLNVFDSGEAQGRPFMVTEYLTGRPLNALGVLTLEHALLYIRQIVGAVSTCLARGLPHPPISSSNVLLINEGQVKLVENWKIPAETISLDLAHYRAPECTEGQPAGPASVVYALGILLYELITGTRPITGSGVQEVCQAHLDARLAPLSQIRPLINLPSLEQLLIRSTARFPEHRLPDIIAFGEEIDALWRMMSTDTQRLAVTPAMPRQQKAARAAAPAATATATANLHAHSPAPAPAPSREDAFQPIQASAIQRKSLVHSLVGWLVILGLLLLVIFGSYTLAGFVSEKFFAITLPQPRLADFGIGIPGWFPIGGKHEILVVTIAGNEGLNLRDAPGTTTNVLRTIPNGSLVEKIDDTCMLNDQTLTPCIVDGVEWVKVRTESSDGKSIEGWMSLLYLKKPDQ